MPECEHEWEWYIGGPGREFYCMCKKCGLMEGVLRKGQEPPSAELPLEEKMRYIVRQELHSALREMGRG